MNNMGSTTEFQKNMLIFWELHLLWISTGRL